jgi:segregation and condensation protein A
VRKQEVDIYQVNLTRIATEFVAYIEQMRELDLDVAGEFVVMAATLLYIKSRELLPADKQPAQDGEEPDAQDPRWDLIRRLVEYKKFKDAAGQLQEREAVMDLVYEHRPARFAPPAEPDGPRGAVSIFDLVHAVSFILKRHSERSDIREIQADPHTVSDRIDFLRLLLASRPAFRFTEIFEAAKTRTEVVVTFLALLELIRLKVLVAIEAAHPGADPVNQAPTHPQLHHPTYPPADFVVPMDVLPLDQPPATNPIGDPTSSPSPS